MSIEYLKYNRNLNVVVPTRGSFILDDLICHYCREVIVYYYSKGKIVSLWGFSCKLKLTARWLNKLEKHLNIPESTLKVYKNELRVVEAPYWYTTRLRVGALLFLLRLAYIGHTAETTTISTDKLLENASGWRWTSDYEKITSAIKNNDPGFMYNHDSQLAAQNKYIGIHTWIQRGFE